jgi:hypothetical protein
MATQRPVHIDSTSGNVRELVSGDKIGGVTGGAATGEVLAYGQASASLSSPVIVTGATPYLQWTSTGSVNWYLQAGVSPTAASSGNYLTALVPSGKGMAVAQSGSGTLFLMDSGGNVSFGTGSTTPLAKCESRVTSGPQFIASYDASNYYSETVSSSGAVVLATSGTNASITLTPSGTGNVILSKIPRFNGTNSTGAGSSLLGANSPATTLTAPYTWISVITSDGSTAYVPCWK